MLLTVITTLCLFQTIVDKSGANRVSIDTESPERDGCSDMIYFIFHGMGLPLIDAKVGFTLIVSFFSTY